jgi:hypothetical protein
VPSGSEALRRSTTAPLLGRRRLPQPHRLRKQHGDGARRNPWRVDSRTAGTMQQSATRDETTPSRPSRSFRRAPFRLPLALAMRSVSTPRAPALMPSFRWGSLRAAPELPRDRSLWPRGTRLLPANGDAVGAVARPRILVQTGKAGLKVEDGCRSTGGNRILKRANPARAGDAKLEVSRQAR